MISLIEPPLIAVMNWGTPFSFAVSWFQLVYRLWRLPIFTTLYRLTYPDKESPDLLESLAMCRMGLSLTFDKFRKG